jgi:thymidine phosphorylase
MESLECLEGKGDPRLVELVLELCELACRLGGHAVGRARLERSLEDGSAREAFLRWARAQGASSGWAAAPRFERAPVEVVIEAPRGGVLAAVRTRDLGLLLQEAARDRNGLLDPGVSLRYRGRLGQAVSAGDELARFYLRRLEPGFEETSRACFVIEEAGETPALLVERLSGTGR